jgi:hypothetical protein
MKKIFLLFMILGLSLMSFVDLEAAQHDTYLNYDLDTINQDLGGVSIRDFFENYNLIQNHDFSNGLTYWNGNNHSINNGRAFVQYTGGSTSYIYQQVFNVNTTDDIYMNFDFELLNGRAVLSSYYYGGMSSQVLSYSGNYSYITNINQGLWLIERYIDNPTTFSIDNVYVINLTTLSVQLSKNELDRYYLIYNILKNNENAYNNGYDTGNLDGYATGFTDGTTYGQNEYHTGNYGTLDETLGIPYNDGYNAGVAEELDTNYLLSFVQGSIAVLGAPILPNITLGVFVFIPLFFGFIAFLFRLGGKRG